MTTPAPVDLADILTSSEPTETLTVQVGDKSFDIDYRPLSWLDKTDCVALATEYLPAEEEIAGRKVATVKTLFHVDVYFEQALRRMIVKSPWPMSKQVLRNLKPEIGEQLQAIIPSPLGDNKDDAENLDEASTTPSKASRKTRSSPAAPSS